MRSVLMHWLIHLQLGNHLLDRVAATVVATVVVVNHGICTSFVLVCDRS